MSVIDIFLRFRIFRPFQIFYSEITLLQGSTTGTGILEFESLHRQLAEMRNKVQLAVKERDDLKNK